jgi:hypothetical protein
VRELAAALFEHALRLLFYALAVCLFLGAGRFVGEMSCRIMLPGRASAELERLPFYSLRGVLASLGVLVVMGCATGMLYFAWCFWRTARNEN